MNPIDAKNPNNFLRAAQASPPRTTKVCPHCSTMKPFAEFPANKRTRDGLSSWCRECHREANRTWRERNPDYSRNWHAKQRGKS